MGDWWWLAGLLDTSIFGDIQVAFMNWAVIWEDVCFVLFIRRIEQSVREVVQRVMLLSSFHS